MATTLFAALIVFFLSFLLIFIPLWKTWYACGVDERSLAPALARCTITSLPNFVGLVDYHISLAMGLRPSAVLRAAREAPL